jgi:signal transduction histidine kinase
VAIRDLIDRRGDATLAVALGALYLVEILTAPEFEGERVVSVLPALIFCASFGWRRRWPLVPLVLGFGLIELSNLAIQPLAETGAFLFGIVIALYTAGAYAKGRTAVAALAVVVIMIPFAAIEPGEAFTFGGLAFFVMFFGGPFAVGRIIRWRREREKALEGRADELEQESDRRTREAVTVERARIARELHDVVSHAISVVLLQARGARRVLHDDEPQVRAALDAIEQSSSEALTEMRRLLGLLRQDADTPALTPRPTLRRVDELVASVTSAGVPVELCVEGEIGELPPGVDVSAYRIVQEALTNALKHAGPAHVHVFIRRRDDELEVEVLDDGVGGTGHDGHDGRAGHGLIGIRERVAVYGGQLQAGERPDGGYAVQARIPLGSTA